MQSGYPYSLHALAVCHGQIAHPTWTCHQHSLGLLCWNANCDGSDTEATHPIDDGQVPIKSDTVSDPRPLQIVTRRTASNRTPTKIVEYDTGPLHAAIAALLSAMNVSHSC